MYPVFIYALNCPVTGITRYAGQTVSPDRRLKDHVRDALTKKWHVSRWVKKLLSKNLRPVMEILDVVPDNEADFWEREYIQNFRERGFDLTNGTDGGRGGPKRLGRKPPPEVCAKISAAHKGKKLSPQHRAKIGTSNKGKPKTPEHRAKIGAVHKGKTVPPETRAKISTSLKGNVPWNKGMKGVQVAWNKGTKGAQIAWNKGKKKICPEKI